MKRLLISTCLLACLSGIDAIAQDSLRYHIDLKDKVATEYSLKHPEKFLSSKALQRRQKQNLQVDSTDLPVPEAYIKAIRQTGVKVLVTSKWENFVTVSCNDTALIDKIRALPFVKSATKVWKTPANAIASSRRDTIINELTVNPDTIYGTSYGQIHVSKADLLHEAGFKGQGMTIAVIDGGFHNFDRIPALDNVKVLGTKDFVESDADIFAESTHGLSVLSCMATNKPGVMIGTAPEASYWLLRSEDSDSEYPIEQDYWVAAVEYADSVGVDLINTSLGYNEFDDSSMDFKLRDLNGKHSVISRAASRLADKGMILVCSAGNSGNSVWKKITPPGDADNVLTVGAIVWQTGVIASFSSVGNTQDGRVKPDVVAAGVRADVINSHGSQGKANGTSFASPIMCGMVACLWQACPTLTAKEVIDLVRQAGDRAEFPDNIYGYGIPDMWKAYQNYLNR
ncbi:MAG: S8 family serine peptidase [Bacteroidaceae bacterium]|nr:S8 family serine peptidase [Bacteroidaceae bacterium]